MGGQGLGRWPSYGSLTSAEETTEDYFALEIREVKRHGLMAPEAEEIPGVARLEWIPAGFGGELGGFLRPWFLCPRAGCQRRERSSTVGSRNGGCAGARWPPSS